MNDNFDQQIRVQVTKRLPKKEIHSIIREFIRQKLTFAVSKHDSEYEVWRQILPGDRPREKNRKDGMVPSGVIEQNLHDLDQRNFICVWNHGKIVKGKFEIR